MNSADSPKFYVSHKNRGKTITDQLKHWETRDMMMNSPSFKSTTVKDKPISYKLSPNNGKWVITAVTSQSKLSGTIV